MQFCNLTFLTWRKQLKIVLEKKRKKKEKAFLPLKGLGRKEHLPGSKMKWSQMQTYTYLI